MTIDDIKTYLRVDHDDDDNLINQLEKTADAYLASAVTDYSSHYENDENFKASADMAKLAIIAELYENRNEAKQDDYSFTIRSMITQLQYWGDTMQKIGTLDKRVHLLGYKDVKNSNGFYEQQFVDLVGHPVYARIEPARGKSFYEQYEANKDASTYMLKVTIRYRKGIDENTVVQYGDNLYNVITAIDPYMRHEKLELMVNQRKRGAIDDD